MEENDLHFCFARQRIRDGKEKLSLSEPVNMVLGSKQWRKNNPLRRTAQT
jgi:hypothetical protein